MPNEESIALLHTLVEEMKSAGRYDVLLDAIGVPVLQQLNIEAAKARLSRLVITADYRFVLADYGKEVELAPIHKVLYLLFLRHPEGIEFKCLVEYKEELKDLYRIIGNRISEQTIEDTIARLVNPLDNSINEKCARIKSAFAAHMDTFQLSYYVISRHSVRTIPGSPRIWYDRKKTITLPRELVEYDAIVG